MKKIFTIILLSINILIHLSCKSDIEIKNLKEKVKLDSIFVGLNLRLSDSIINLSSDSISSIYFSTENNQQKASFLKKLNNYIDIKMQKALFKKQEIFFLKEKIRITWASSKAGKIQISHPNWSKEECDNVANNNIWIGMSLDMLKYMRGQPNRSSPSNYGNGIQWQWCWDRFTPSCFYGDNTGVITAFN